MEYTIAKLMPNIFAIVVLAIVFVCSTYKSFAVGSGRKNFLSSIISVGAVVLFSALSIVSEHWSTANAGMVNFVFTSFYFALQPLATYFVFLFVLDLLAVYFSMRARLLFLIPFFVNVILVIVNCFHPLCFNVTDQNIYLRGDFFWLVSAFGYCYLVAAVVFLLVFRKRLSKQIVISLAIGALIPSVALAVQLTLPEAEILWASASLSLLLIFLFVILENVELDPLTRLNNRRQLEYYYAYLSRKKLSGGGRAFSAMMFDLNHFKKINDEYGHVAGDEALRIGALALKAVAPKGSFLCRFAGDEFIMISEGDNPTLESEVRADLLSKEADIGKGKGQKFPIHFAVGYYLFEGDKIPNFATFLDLIDERMYEDKHRKEK